jgi:uncharacterized membrane protein YccC
LRAAIATVVPLAVAHLHAGATGTWMALAGFTGAVADKGGPYHTRAATIGTLATAGALTVSLGTLAGPRHGLAVPLTFAVALACSLARVWGNAGASVGGSVLNIYVIALALPPATAGEAVSRAAQVLIGGAWAMVVALVIWPLRPYRPVRLAVSAGYRALAAYADELAKQVQSDAISARSTGDRSLTVRRALEDARAVLAATRRGRPGESERGERLVVLREAVDQLFGHMLALSEGIEAIPASARDPSAQQALADTLAQVARTARQLGDAVEEERGSPDVKVGWSGAGLRGITVGGHQATSDAYAHAAIVLDRMAQYAGVAAGTVATLNEGGPVPASAGALGISAPEPGPSALSRLRAALAPDSIVLRHGLRLALVVTAAVLLTSALHLKRGYWVTITAVLIMQPYAGVTSLRALQRVLGTVLGGILTAALGALFHDPVAILPLTFVFAGIAVALLPINYAAFSVFLTPTFVLLAEASTGDWHLAGIRIVNTIIGGGLALLGSRLLWPSPERERVPSYLVAALRANRDYLGEAITLFGDRTERASQRLRDARRQVELATLNAEESFQRLLAEHRGSPDGLAQLMTFLTFIRRVTASTASLAVTRFSTRPPEPESLEPFGDASKRVLDDLSAAALERRSPAPLLSLEEATAISSALPPLVRERVERLSRQLRSLHDSLARWIATDTV